MKVLERWLISATSLMVVSEMLRGFEIDSFYAAVIAALVLGLLNTIVRPVIILLTLPINLLTLGLFTLFINGGIIYFVGTFVKGFSIDFSSAVVASVLLWLINLLINAALKED